MYYLAKIFALRGFAVILASGCLFLTTPSPAQNPPALTTNNPQPTNAPVQGVSPQAAAAPADTPPSSLEQRPASAPKVAFQNGELSIVAQNSTLGAILQDVEAQTGASIDMPVVPTDRVVGQFGPGPAREVLASLLNGSHFNYVLLGTPQDPNALERVVLLSKTSSADESIASSQPVAPPQGSPSHPAVNPDQDNDDSNSQDNAEMMQSEDPVAQDQTDQNNGTPNGSPGIKSPQELLQELQRQQQIQQQVQQQQGASPQGGPSPQTQERRPQ